MVYFVLFLGMIGVASAVPIKILVIGDSQSEEYRFEVPFSDIETLPDGSKQVNLTAPFLHLESSLIK